MPLPTPYPYIVCVELKTPLGNYAPLFAALQSSVMWWHYMTPVWLVKRNETLTELQTLLLPLIYQGDRLLILPAKRPAGGWLPQDAWQWIAQNIPREW